jgi:hypothetical protein
MCGGLGCRVSKDYFAHPRQSSASSVLCAITYAAVSSSKVSRLSQIHSPNNQIVQALSTMGMLGKQKCDQDVPSRFDNVRLRRSRSIGTALERSKFEIATFATC